MHSSALKQATKELDNALFQIPLATFSATLDIQEHLATLVDGRTHERFDERAARVHQTNVLEMEIGEVSDRMNKRFEDVTFQINQQFDDVKNQLGDLMQRRGLRSETTGTLMLTANLVNDISDEVTKVSTNKEECKQLEEFTKTALEILKTIEEKELTHSLVLVSLKHVNEALANVMSSINSCCNANPFLHMASHRNNSLRLKEASMEFGNALGKMALYLQDVPASMKYALDNLYNELHNALCEKVVDVQVDNSLKEKPSDTIEVSQPIWDYNGQFPLHFASLHNLVDTVKKLIVDGYDIEIQNDKGQTPLCIACQNNHTYIVKELIANGADVSLQERMVAVAHCI